MKPATLPFIVLLAVVAVFAWSGTPVIADSPGPGTSPEITLTPAILPGSPIEPVVDGKVVVYFFYNQDCSECTHTLPFVQDYARTHPDVIVRFYDIKDSPENRALFSRFNQEYAAGFVAVPAAFVGPYVLEGYEQVTGELDLKVQETTALVAGNLTPEVTPTPQGPGQGRSQVLTIPLVIGAALVDGINPCAFSVLIFLLLTIMSLGSRRKMLEVGTSFIVAVFVFYFLSGLGLFTAIQISGVSQAISVVAAFIAIAAGVLSFRDAFRKEGGPALAIPESRKGMIERFARVGSVPAAFVLGILVGMFELPCTGGIYLAILSLLSQEMTLMQGLPLLLLYNLIFILPLVIILAVVAYGISAERLETWRVEKRRTVRILMGAVMIGLGILLLWEVLV
ncbi:cytochrome c biogenesis protein CcdA [Methanolinea mesophila]|uniref:cytochrome c biogenesis protein CcdA n=1 Tax=Methanolinea mesophila TaxID=547055 RepID=UPI001AEB2F27|nr:cytochrome c biogenesis protein CcdA [Methanolinea mesophila]MBP1929069.1 cytochrome c biogenesis protein CcdA [Methanolinea mesophila]